MPRNASSTSRENPLLWGFMGELDTQCANAELAYMALVMALSERDPDGNQTREQQRKIFFHAHAFLVHAAMISRILWPAHEAPTMEMEPLGIEDEEALKALRKERGKRLRKALGNEVAMLKGLGLWEYLEGSDARIEAWAIRTSLDGAEDMAIGPADASRGAAITAIRHFDPITMTYTFLGTPFDLAAIAAVLSWTHRAVARWVSEQAGARGIA
jgi:hypothetical protein